MKPLLIATNNQHKFIEMTQILAPLPFRFLSANDIGLDVDVTEDGLSYLENARKKALAFFHASGLPTLADDSGLEVAALQGLTEGACLRARRQADSPLHHRCAAVPLPASGEE